ncbi:three-prime repair exonuclease 1-like [Melitaea cinxia]|uniref:three-prime repair exonuclease 1-like n=1 Tax=Melitaea cinxia TaxID=113334 RepID=UPI001E2719E9|nr:three-prime repair exonuclease 1-like [Melitaea cinxia]
MVVIATYVFIDLETTGLPEEENNCTRITELSLVAIKRNHVLATRPGATPRVQHKLTLCFNPGRPVAPSCTDVTGLCNFLLEYEPRFNVETFTMINTFLTVLEKPVCLIAHNGHRFDFPILKNHLTKHGLSLANDLLCADCLHGFYDVMEGNMSPNLNIKENHSSGDDTFDENDNKLEMFESETSFMQRENERTPEKQKFSLNRNNVKSISHVRRQLFWNKGPSPKKKYKLSQIYERLFNEPAVGTHHAENDCEIALKCFVVLVNDMVKWFDQNACFFSEVRPMTAGVPLGR